MEEVIYLAEEIQQQDTRCTLNDYIVEVWMYTSVLKWLWVSDFQLTKKRNFEDDFLLV